MRAHSTCRSRSGGKAQQPERPHRLDGEARDDASADRAGDVTTEDVVQRVVDYIRMQSGSLSLSRSIVGRDFGVSTSWLAHNIKAVTGLSFTEHVQRARILHACHLLRQTGLSVKAIALSVGYRDTSALDHQFHARMGATPSHWRAH